MVGYYKKTFSGTKPAGTSQKLYAMDTNLEPSSTQISSGNYTGFCTIVGEAVATMLRERGLSNCYYDSDKGYLFFNRGIDLSGLYIYTNGSNYFYFVAPKNSTNTIYTIAGNPSSSASGRGYGNNLSGYVSPTVILKGATLNTNQQDYEFSVVFKGNVNSFFRIFLCQYNTSTEIEICGVGFFDWGENKNAVIGYQMHANKGGEASPYWYLVRSDNLIFLSDSASLDTTPSTSNMPRSVGLSGNYWPKNGYAQSAYASLNYLSLSPLIFNYNAGVINPKIFYMPYGYFNNTSLTLSSSDYERFFKDGDRIFMQENSFCIELTDTSPASGGSYVSGTKTITNNGTYNASDDGYDGYSSVSANIPSSVLTTKTISSNGTYNASSDNADGYSSVTVNVPSSSGNATVIDLGEFSFASDGVITTNISSVYPDYANLTKDNFIIDITQMTTTTCQKEDWFNGVNQQSTYDTDVFYLKTSLYIEKLYNTSSGKFTYRSYNWIQPIKEVLNDSSTVGETLPYKNSGTNHIISTPTKARIYLVVFNS